MRKIILIEDDLQICEVIQDYFQKQGTEIQAVHNGLEALELVRGDISGTCGQKPLQHYFTGYYASAGRWVQHLP